jgi:hypothetical protein
VSASLCIVGFVCVSGVRASCRSTRAVGDVVRGAAESGAAAGYLFAACEEELRMLVRNTPGLPLITLNRTVVSLEPPSTASRQRSVEVRTRRHNLACDAAV